MKSTLLCNFNGKAGTAMKSFIIGGAGFVGDYLIRYLQAEGQKVAVTKMPGETIDIPDADVYDLNILDKDGIADLLEKVRPDYVYHLAAQSSVAVSWKNPQLTIDVNIKGSVNVLEAIRGLSHKPRTLLIGSGEEYGPIRPEETPVTEENAIRPGNIYAATKACQNMFGRIYAQAFGLEVMMVRAFNHIGPNQDSLFVVADFCRQTAEIEAGLKKPVIKVGNLSVARDFTDVRDVVRAYDLLIRKGETGETYNIGSGRAIVIEDILNMILSKSKTKIQVEKDPSRFRPVDVPTIEADTRKVYEVTGWVPKIPLEQTIQETLDYWRRKI